MQIKKGETIRVKGGFAKPRGKHGFYTVYINDNNYADGYKPYATGSDDPNNAHQKLVDLVAARGNGHRPAPNGKITMQHLFDGLIAHYVRQDYKTTDWVKRRIRLHLGPKLGHLKPTEVTKATIFHYIDQRKAETSRYGKPYENATINRDLSDLRESFKLALDSETITYMPSFKKVFLQETVRENQPEPEECEAILQTETVREQPWLAVYYQFLWGTGHRKNAVLNVEWKHINFKTGKWYAPSKLQKNKKANWSPLLPNLLEVLKVWNDYSMKYFPDCPYVFHRDGVQVKEFYTAHDKAMEQAGIPGTWIHDFKRVFYHNGTEAGIDGKTLRELCNQKSRSMEDRYKIVFDRDQQIAVKRLDAFMGERLEKTGTAGSELAEMLESGKKADKKQTNGKKRGGLKVVK
jgi:integrase